MATITKSQSLTKHLDELKGALPQGYWVLVKNRILGPDESINPFQDTINSFLQRDQVWEKFEECGLEREKDFFIGKYILKGTLLRAIQEN
ncbi:MAG: hypothetical protein ACLFSL_05035 [Candidatus Woesearchaeota archaeon]